MSTMKQNFDSSIGVDLCAIGAKAVGFFKNFGGNVLASKRNIGEAPSAIDVVGVVKVMLDKFVAGELDEVHVIGNKFISDASC